MEATSVTRRLTLGLEDWVHDLPIHEKHGSLKTEAEANPRPIR